MAVIAGALSVTALSGNLAWSTQLKSPFSSLVFALLGALGVAAALKAARRIGREHALAFELVGGQRESGYEVTVTLNPRSSVLLTGVTATLRWGEKLLGRDEFILLAPCETLFEGSKRLGHGEKFARKATIPLPAMFRWRTASEDAAHIFYAVIVLRVEVDGVPYIDHEETVELQRDYMTLSQT